MVTASALEREELPSDLGLPQDPIPVAPTSIPPSSGGERLGGVRADFISALGRRVAELLSLIGRLDATPHATDLGDDLRRRLQALAANARLLRFTRLASRLADAERRLAVAAGDPAAERDAVADLRACLDDLPSIAWGDASAPDSSPPGAPPPSAGRSVGAVREEPRGPQLDSVRAPFKTDGTEGRTSSSRASDPPQTVLVIGPRTLADALTSGAFEVEHLHEDSVAHEVARAMAPDVIVIDADRAHARDLCVALLSDSLTEAVPIVAVGSWSRPEAAAPFVALGVARTLAKPVSPDALRRACIGLTNAHLRSHAAPGPLGRLSVEELGDRLADDLRRGLCDAAHGQGRGSRIDLGDGSDVLAALWGAVARIRDLCTIHSAGSVRFSPTGPEGALPIAPWLGGGGAGGDRRPGSAQKVRAGSASLERKVVVVADDDPAVTWFLSGLLRGAGAIVHEAHDGARALEIALRVTPDLMISDVLMPELDGFGLCRTLRRDVVLRDVPVILLSWKEDLLQRVRELGAEADGYLRKEASTSVILQRVREVMSFREQVAQRLAGDGEVRGRLDGLTTRTLLGLASAIRPDSLVTVRDSAYLYEVELRAGRPVRAAQTDAEGTSTRGPSVLGSLLGVGAGRFVVATSQSRVDEELFGTLSDQLLSHVAAARAAQALLSGASLVSVERVDLANARMSSYLAATPDPARSLLCTLAAGASPRALITSGQAAPRLLEDVLCDAASRGAITAVIGKGGESLLEDAIERQLETLQGTRSRRPTRVIPALDLGPMVFGDPNALGTVQSDEDAPFAPPALGAEPPNLGTDPSALPPVAQTDLNLVLGAKPVLNLVRNPSPASPASPDLNLVTPSDPNPPSDPNLVPGLEPNLVSNRLASLSPNPSAGTSELTSELNLVAGSGFDVNLVKDPSPRDPSPSAPSVTLGHPVASLGTLVPPPVRPTPRPGAAPPRAPAPATARPLRPATDRDQVDPPNARTDDTPMRNAARPSAFVPPSAFHAEAKTKAAEAGPGRAMWLLFAAAGLTFAIGARLSHDRDLQRVDSALPATAPVVSVAPPGPQPTAAPLPPAASVTPAAAPAAQPSAGVDLRDAEVPQEVALRPDDKVPPGQGMLEVVAGTKETIFIDSILVGTGPVVKRALAPRAELYEVRVKSNGEDRVRFAPVKEGRLTRVRVSPPWSR